MTSIADKTAEFPKQLYHASQVREMDRYAIESLGVPGFVLMANAGESAFQLMRTSWPEADRLGIVCGAGNNGGDGYVLATKALETGLNVRVYALTPIENLKGDALTAAESFIDAGDSVENFALGCFDDRDLVVDGLLGTGLDRPVTGAYADVINTVNRYRGKVMALDIPSGLNADTGCPMGIAVRAQKTITFIGLKQGLFTGEAADYCGELHYHSLGVSESVCASQKPTATLIADDDITFSRRRRCAHKGHFGHVLVVGGELGYSGAARLAGEAAARVGAGLVSIATRPEHAVVMNLNRPELMCHGIENSEDLEPFLQRVSAIALGPGLGRSPWAANLMETVMSSGIPLVVDADGLNLLAAKPQKRGNWVLTPHPGEAARLLDCLIPEVLDDRFRAANDLLHKYGGVCLLKGAGTLVAEEGASIAVNTTGNPGMATGGMGDVLTGIIAGLIAQGFDMGTAARIGAWLHGASADEASRQGERGLLPSDLFAPLRRLSNQ